MLDCRPLAKRGLPHPTACLLCDQAEESIQHLLVSCVFSRQVWFLILHHLNLDGLAPTLLTTRFSSWWGSALRGVPKELRKRLNSLIILVAWEIWKHRNSCVFEGSSPNHQTLLQNVANEYTVWCMASASKLRELLAGSVAPQD